MIPLLLPILSLVSSGIAPGEVQVSARLEASALTVGPTYEIVLDLALPAGLSNANSKIAPVLQIDVPDGVTLDGEVLTTHEDLARNEFLQEPFERALTDFPARIAFQLEKAPEAGATIGLNLVAYLIDDADQHSFLRRRLELPLAPMASARRVDELRSDWTTDVRLLQIGQRAADFELPREDGSLVGLTDYIGEKNIIVTTYRAFW